MCALNVYATIYVYDLRLCTCLSTTNTLCVQINPITPPYWETLFFLHSTLRHCAWLTLGLICIAFIVLRLTVTEFVRHLYKHFMRLVENIIKKFTLRMQALSAVVTLNNGIRIYGLQQEICGMYAQREELWCRRHTAILASQDRKHACVAEHIVFKGMVSN